MVESATIGLELLVASLAKVRGLWMVPDVMAGFMREQPSQCGVRNLVGKRLQCDGVECGGRSAKLRGEVPRSGVCDAVERIHHRVVDTNVSRAPISICSRVRIQRTRPVPSYVEDARDD